MKFSGHFFCKQTNGFLCGDRYLAKSTDGGLTWKQVLPDSLIESWVNLYFLDANTGWVFGAPNFFLSTKMGAPVGKKRKWPAYSMGNLWMLALVT